MVIWFWNPRNSRQVLYMYKDGRGSGLYLRGIVREDAGLGHVSLQSFGMRVVAGWEDYQRSGGPCLSFLFQWRRQVAWLRLSLDLWLLFSHNIPSKGPLGQNGQRSVAHYEGPGLCCDVCLMLRCYAVWMCHLCVQSECAHAVRYDRLDAHKAVVLSGARLQKHAILSGMAFWE